MEEDRSVWGVLTKAGYNEAFWGPRNVLYRDMSGGYKLCPYVNMPPMYTLDLCTLLYVNYA